MLGALALAAGCNSLPPGDPPPGAIVSNRRPAELSPAAAEERLQTSFNAFVLLRSEPEIALRLAANDPAALAVARRLVARSSRLAPVRIAAAADWVLTGSIAGETWAFQIDSPAGRLWQERLTVAPAGTALK